jgi:putative chitinase
MVLNENQLKQLFPTNKNLKELCLALNTMLPKYEINTLNRVAGFLAQCGHESANFTVLRENLNYSARGLLLTFPKYFRPTSLADQYARKPEKIANRVYANRMGNGNELSGDGYKYRGRGAIQLTGKDNYTLFAKSINKSVDDTIQYLETLEGALESACWFWNTRKLNSVCDRDDIVRLSRLINGGTKGLEDRKSRYERAKKVLS